MNQWDGKHQCHPYSLSGQNDQQSISHSHLPVRSTKKTKLCQSDEQKTQYLESILRMSHQKSNTNSSTFDRIRFTLQSNVTTITSTENSYQFIPDGNDNSGYSALEDFLRDNISPSNKDQNITCKPTHSKTSDPHPWSGFLIDNCDDVQSPALSSPSPPLLSSSMSESVHQIQENSHAEQVMFANEFNAAHHEEREELERHKRLQKKLQRRKNQSNVAITTNQQTDNIVNKQNSIESASDWIIEYDCTNNDQISQLTNAVKQISTTISDKNKLDQIHLILTKIKRQQLELKKLRQHVLSMLDNQEQSNLTEQNDNENQDILMNFLNQPLTSGCWLCSGKLYTEVASQCTNTNE